MVRLRVKEVIHTNAGVEQVALRDARRVEVVISCAWRRNTHPSGRELWPWQIAGCYGARQGGRSAPAVQADESLFVGIQGESGLQVSHLRNQPAIVTPG